jgi:cation/acetate symporter
VSLTLGIFIVILLITVGITYWAAKRTSTTADFYAADSALTSAQNGFALAGDWCSAAAFLGFTGLTALYGMDGAFYALGPLVAFCTVLFLIAEPMRNTGRYTLGDIIRSRMQTRTSLLAAIVGTVVVNFAYLMPQMAGAGVLVRLLTGISYDWAVIFVGASMIVYVTFGGMLATTWVQIVKAVLMLSAGAIILLMILSMVRLDLLSLFAETERKYGANYLLPGNYLKNPFDQISLGLGFALGLAGLPHVMTRFYTVPDAATARRSVVWVMFLAGAFFAGTTLFGLAAADFVGLDAIRAADKGGNLTLPLLAQYLGGGKATFGGDLMLGFVSAVAVATILAVVSALTLSTSSSIAHDFYVNWVKRGQVDGKREVWLARPSRPGRQRRRSRDPCHLHRRQRQLSGLDPFVVLAAIQHRRRGRRHDGGAGVFCRTGHDRAGDARRRCPMATGQSDHRIDAVGFPWSRSRHVSVGAR